MSDKALESVLENVTQTSLNPAPVQRKKLNAKQLRDRDNKLIKGKFHFHECPGSVLAFVYQEHKEDPIRRYSLVDGQIYTLPFGVAKHINTNVAYPIYEHYKGAQGAAPMTAGINPDSGMTDMRVKYMKKRASFESLEFISDPEYDVSGPMIESVEILPFR